MDVTTGSFLELLLADAEAEEFDAPPARARARGEPPETLAELDRQRLLALRLREILIGQRRNGAELRLLNDTANDLASLHDLDTILQAISDRARRLLNCDLAYISLNDEDESTYVKAASGNISGALRELRLPKGTGVGGLVARTGEPHHVLSYSEDDSIVHRPEIDKTVLAEGIRSLLGVPVKLKQSVIGVLLAAHRSPRTFSSRDISALAMLGAHAAVAIQNARLLAETQAAVADLRVANATIRSHAEDLERIADVHERLTRLVIHGKSVEDVVAVAAASASGAVALLDRDGAVVTAAGPAPLPPGPGLASVAARAQESGRSVVRDGLCAVPMIADSEVLGSVVMHGVAAVSDIDRRTLEVAALVASLVLVTRRRMAEVEARVRGELLEDLLATSAQDHDLLRHRASLLGVDLGARHVVVVARADPQVRDRLHTAANALARRSGGLATGRKDEVVLLLPGANPGAVAQEAVRELSGATSRPVTAGGAGGGGASIAAAYDEASRCVRALLALGRAGEAADARDLGFVGILFGSRPDIGSFIDATVGPLIEYDRDRGGSLLETTEVFCATGQNTTATAQAMHLHPNTVAQRLARIARLLGDSWREPDRMLEIQVALRLLKVGRR
ncbi:helix-turn-helix domain-containing protein [Bailinhaonella thermotolerans]|uniref:GAF domain-containing protein n=1 Tax=Bailinhaonella thermotolerans TaxID=1070861 RepID=A0A3A4AVN8_9ACTN|nr:GAF domain-containing protein [Bailinhaonella thermotolerans]RJL32781.1 GAF domain-containing protein [Bailinhaonella thermotolerans]